MSDVIFETRDLGLSYRLGDQDVDVLKGLDFKVERGDLVAIQGPSGSGKSTLFYILGFLLRPTRGEVRFDGLDITQYSDDQLAWIRNRRIGFVFQQFHLLPRASVVDNILLPVAYPLEVGEHEDDFSPARERPREKAIRLAQRFGLGEHLRHLPNQLSGGQQQRVAIARALMNDVDLILADEPTGNLDSKSAGEVLGLLEELNAQGKTVVIITHDAEVARRCRKIYHLRDGAITSVEETRASSVASAARASKTSPGDSFAKSEVMPKTMTPSLYLRLVDAVSSLAFENLVRNRTKSLLTMLGVVIGVASVLAMITLGQYTKRKILASYETLGVNKIMIRGYQNFRLTASDIVAVYFYGFDPVKDFAPLKPLFPEIQMYSPVLADWSLRVSAGGLEIPDKISTFGVTPEYFLITNRKIRLGRAITKYHVESISPVCVIGHEIAEKLFVRANPIDQVIRVSDGQRTTYPCQVIGVMESTTSPKEWSPPDRHIIMPMTYFKSTARNRWTAEIHEVSMQIDPRADIVQTGQKIKAYFVSKYGRSGEFWVDSDSTLVAQMKRFLNLFAVLLGSIALISLLVGGIGINNMMLVSVSDRIKEFGIRKALGATNRSIRVQVLMESFVLCIVAGLIGAIAGFSAYQLMIFGATKFVPNLQYEWVFEPLAIFASVISIAAVGVASGFIPAMKAERLQIIEALRNE